MGATVRTSLPPIDLPSPKPSPTCVGCGSYHGSTTLGIRCLEANLLRLRAIVEAVEGRKHACRYCR